MTRTKMSLLVAYGSAILLLAFSAFPLLWMFSTALKPLDEIFEYPPTIFPKQFTVSNFLRLFEESHFIIYLKNSVTVATGTVLLTLTVASAGAYGLTRYHFPGCKKIAGLILLTYMFAPIMIIIPFYILVKEFGLANTHVGLILSYTTFCLPFCLWLLRAFFQSIPIELEEAALVDGANRLKAVLYVVLPQALPGLIATSIFTFILAWNDFLFALVLLTSDELKTLPIGIQDLFNATIVDWGMIMSAGVMITIPALIFFAIVQKYLIQGWGAGGVKG